MPAPKVVTGDRQLDAVLWLRECIETAHPVLIEKALEAFKKIKMPGPELEKRYTAHVARASNGHFGAVLMTVGFADLEDLARTSIKKKARRDEAMARFGTTEELFKLTPAEDLCRQALRGLKRSSKAWGDYDCVEAAARFAKRPELVPHTLADCLHEQAYWDSLYWLRNAIDKYGSEPHPAGSAHDDYSFAMMANIAPRSKEEALQVYQHLEDKEGLNRKESPSILRNLISGGLA